MRSTLSNSIAMVRAGAILLFLALIFGNNANAQLSSRGEVGTSQTKFIWTGTGQAFVPNFIMIDVLKKDLDEISESDVEELIREFFVEHGFNGVHLQVNGQWFHLGKNEVSLNDTVPDPETFEKLSMIIRKVYAAGGCTYLWIWGDHDRKWTARSTRGGIMGPEEQCVMDEIAEELGPLPGWIAGYGFDLWEWVSEDELKRWHQYMGNKDGWNHLLGARSEKNQLTQLYGGMDFSSYEFHKPSYEVLRSMLEKRPGKPSISSDRYRIRNNPPSKWPEKDFSEEETLRAMWDHTMAGGVGAIWGNLDGNGVYGNKDALKCFSVFWNDKRRFRQGLEADNSLTNGYCLRDSDEFYVFYKASTETINYMFSGTAKKVLAVDARKAYQEIEIGMTAPGRHVFRAPYQSDWVVVVEKTED